MSSGWKRYRPRKFSSWTKEGHQREIERHLRLHKKFVPSWPGHKSPWLKEAAKMRSDHFKWFGVKKPKPQWKPMSRAFAKARAEKLNRDRLANMQMHFERTAQLQRAQAAVDRAARIERAKLKAAAFKRMQIAKALDAQGFGKPKKRKIVIPRLDDDEW